MTCPVCHRPAAPAPGGEGCQRPTRERNADEQPGSMSALIRLEAAEVECEAARKLDADQ